MKFLLPSWSGRAALALLPPVAVAGWALGPIRWNRQPTHPARVAGAVEVAGATFGVRGDLEGLHPGGTLPLQLTLTNENGFPISVTLVAVSVGDATWDCPGTVVSAGELPGPVFVPAMGRAVVAVAVHMAGDVPAGCEGAGFPLSYEATAVRA
ncbi:MAG: hypothetical protein ACRD0S_00060 [Acidimicrobiales bacterium]